MGVPDDEEEPAAIPPDDAPIGDLGNDGPPSSRAEADRILSRADMAPETRVPVENGGGGAPREGYHFLHSMLNRSVFFDYFVHVAHARYAGKDPEPKVRKLIQDSRRLYQLVIALDIGVRILVATILIGGGSWVLLKTLWPLPWITG